MKNSPRFSFMAAFIKKHRGKTVPLLSQNNLADMLGYKNGQFISNIERGLCTLPAEKMLALSRILNVDITLVMAAATSDYTNNLAKDVFEIKQ